ncbi:hypothetical protein MMC16_003386 [Acarospora aff. strigata]|nr:hypothetical protein [Acarospora aff. strigata]
MVISDAVTDTACFPYTVLAGNAHPMSSTASGSVYRSSATTHSQPPTPQHPHPSSQSSHSSRATPTILSPNGVPSSTQYAPNTHPPPVPSTRTEASPHDDKSTSRRQQSDLQQSFARQSQNVQPQRHSSHASDQHASSHTNTTRGFGSSPASPRLQPSDRSSRSLAGSAVTSPSRIKVRDISHIHSFASEEFLMGSRQGELGRIRGLRDAGQQYEISSMPVPDIIEMVAGLLTKITTTNDRQHEHLHRHIPPPEGTTGLSQQTTSVLAFHGKNVPSITILSYLSRIHKYCPTTYEVFLSLLVYFDRMTEMVNNGSVRSLRQSAQHAEEGKGSPSGVRSMSPKHSIKSSKKAEPTHPPVVTPPFSDSFEVQDQRAVAPSPHATAGPDLKADPLNLSHFFVVDSFNIHRLVIAGVTCASKFFSDVFYTNSRYAKVCYNPDRQINIKSLTSKQVGGLPLVELNHLELQFLLLNDFRLSVPVEELDAYGTMLVEFYAREVMAQQQGETEGVYDERNPVQTQTPP